MSGVRWEMPRLRAVFRKCLLVHPASAGCECEAGQCKLRGMLKSTAEHIEKEMGEIVDMEDSLNAEPATVRPDWKRPTPPEAGYFLSVINDSGEWCLHWYSETHKVDYIPIEGPDGWPFIEETARTRDWQKLGVTVFAP